MLKKKELISIVNRDLRQGLIKKWYYYFGAFIVVAFAMIDYYNIIINDFNSVDFTFIDCLKKFYYGVADSVGNEEYSFPTVFFSYLIIPYIIVSFYPSMDFLERGKLIFTRTGSKSVWWYSKCIWMVCGLMLYMLLFYVGMMIFSSIFGEMSFELIYEDEGAVLTTYEKCMQFIVLPTITTISLGIMQMAISVATTPLYGMLVQIIQLTLSMLYISPLLPGNNYMYVRSVFYREDGVSVECALIVCLVISLLSIVSGKFIVEKKDIL